MVKTYCYIATDNDIYTAHACTAAIVFTLSNIVHIHHFEAVAWMHVMLFICIAVLLGLLFVSIAKIRYRALVWIKRSFFLGAVMYIVLSDTPVCAVTKEAKTCIIRHRIYHLQRRPHGSPRSAAAPAPTTRSTSAFCSDSNVHVPPSLVSAVVSG